MGMGIKEAPTAMSAACSSTELPMTIRPLFLAAGWYLGREVPVPTSIAAEHTAAIVMSEFGGLRVGKSGPGKDCAASDVHFSEAYPEELITDVWGLLLNTELVKVGDVCSAHAALYIDAQGRYFEAGPVHDLAFAGASFGEAMEKLLLGHRLRPMLSPDQLTVMMYGEEIPADHPSVYRYR